MIKSYGKRIFFIAVSVKPRIFLIVGIMQLNPRNICYFIPMDVVKKLLSQTFQFRLVPTLALSYKL